jgi:hypothetical protein
MQYGSFPVCSARRLVGRAEAWVLFGLERVGKTLGVIWGRCTMHGACFSSVLQSGGVECIRKKVVGCDVLVNGDLGSAGAPEMQRLMDGVRAGLG